MTVTSHKLVSGCFYHTGVVPQLPLIMYTCLGSLGMPRSVFHVSHHSYRAYWMELQFFHLAYMPTAHRAECLQFPASLGMTRSVKTRESTPLLI